MSSCFFTRDGRLFLSRSPRRWVRGMFHLEVRLYSSKYIYHVRERDERLVAWWSIFLATICFTQVSRRSSPRLVGRPRREAPRGVVWRAGQNPRQACGHHESGPHALRLYIYLQEPRQARQAGLVGKVLADAYYYSNIENLARCFYDKLKVSECLGSGTSRNEDKTCLAGRNVLFFCCVFRTNEHWLLTQKNQT